MSNSQTFHCVKCKTDLPINHLVLGDKKGLHNKDGDYHLGCMNCFTEQKQFKFGRDFYVTYGKENRFKFK